MGEITGGTWSSHHGTEEMIRLRTMRLQVQSLASLSGLRIWRCRELWYRPAAVAPVGPLAQEPPYAVDAALKRKKNKTKQNKTKPQNKKQNPKRTLSVIAESALYPKSDEEPLKIFKLWSDISRLYFGSVTDGNERVGSSRRGAVVNESD